MLQDFKEEGEISHFLLTEQCHIFSKGLYHEKYVPFHMALIKTEEKRSQNAERLLNNANLFPFFELGNQSPAYCCS